MALLVYSVTFISIFVIAAVSLNLMVGYTGLFTVSHGALLGVGAYSAALLALHFGVPFLVTGAAALLMAAVVSVLVALPSFRVTGDYLVVATIATQVLLETIFFNWRDVTGGAEGLYGLVDASIFGVSVVAQPERFMMVAVFFAALACGFGWLLVRAPFGTSLKSIRDDEVVAAALGKNVASYKVRVSLVAGCLAGVAGWLLAYFLTAIDPSSFNTDVSILIFSMVVIGGSGRIRGAIAGAIVVIGIQQVLRYLNLPNDVVGPLRQAAYGLLLTGFMFVRPNGLLGEYVGGRHSGSPLEGGGAIAAALAWLPTSLREALRGKDSCSRAGTSADRAARDGFAGVPNACRGSVAPSADRSNDVERQPVANLTGNRPPGDKAATPPLIVCENVEAGYRGRQVLRGVTLESHPGEVVTILGHNGAGKSTLLKVIAGLLDCTAHRLAFDGVEVADGQHWSNFVRGRRVSFMPQGGDVFPEMSVYENLVTAGYFRRKSRLKQRIDDVLDLFPVLAQRTNQRADTLSGGQRRTLALAMAIVPEARVLVLDEPSIGLSPVMVESVLATIRSMADSLGVSVIVSEQNVRPALKISDRAYVLKAGEVVAHERGDNLLREPNLWELF